MKNQSGEDQGQMARNDEHDEGWYHPGQSGADSQSKEQKTDEQLKEEIKDRLAGHGLLDSSRIEISVNGSVVSLKGTVNTLEDKYMAETTVEGVQGVQDVENQLIVGSHSDGEPG